MNYLARSWVSRLQYFVFAFDRMSTFTARACCGVYDEHQYHAQGFGGTGNLRWVKPLSLHPWRARNRPPPRSRVLRLGLAPARQSDRSVDQHSALFSRDGRSRQWLFEHPYPSHQADLGGLLVHEIRHESYRLIVDRDGPAVPSNAVVMIGPIDILDRCDRRPGRRGRFSGADGLAVFDALHRRGWASCNSGLM